MSIANNHALDAGRPGLLDTKRILNRANISAAGDGATIGGKIRLQSYELAAADFVEDPNATVPMFEHPGGVKIVFAHWGEEYSSRPSPRQQQLAADMIEAGAHLVIGAHPHVIQPVQEIRRAGRTGVIVYSLGNLVFDQPHRGMVIRAMLGKRGVERLDAKTIEIKDAIPRPAAREAIRFDGRGFELTGLDPQPRERRAKLEIDLRGDGRPLDAALDDGVVTVREKTGAVVWRNESPDWRVTRMEAGDPDRDGRLELLLLVHKNGGTHPFIMGERSGRFRIVWGGSATARKIRDFALGDFDGDSVEELAVLDDDGELSIWAWYAWGFQEVVRSEVSRYDRVDAGASGTLVLEVAPHQ
jgi:poly-gamma-glutamate synthesis protein (capsule biosynthesis protein)